MNADPKVVAEPFKLRHDLSKSPMHLQPATDTRADPKVVAAMNAAIGASVGAPELAAWSGCPLRVARAWLAEMSNVRRGRRLFTTVPWLAEWLAQNVKNRPRITHFDPLQKTVATLAAWTVGELQRQGKIAVLQGSTAHETETAA
jgi:hypothetical protein